MEENNIEVSEKAFTTSEIAKNLNMGVTTVRKYAQYLEKAGYEFFKTKHNARLFVEKDIKAIQYLKELRDKTNITVEQATNIVMEKIDHIPNMESNISVNPSPPNAVKPEQIKQTENHEELKQLLLNQNDLIQQLIDKLDKQEEIVHEQLNERDKTLMRLINEKLEAQKQIAAAEEVKVNEQPSFFSRLFGKNK